MCLQHKLLTAIYGYTVGSICISFCGGFSAVDISHEVLFHSRKSSTMYGGCSASLCVGWGVCVCSPMFGCELQYIWCTFTQQFTVITVPLSDLPYVASSIGVVVWEWGWKGSLQFVLAVASVNSKAAMTFVLFPLGLNSPSKLRMLNDVTSFP